VEGPARHLAVDQDDPCGGHEQERASVGMFEIDEPRFWPETKNPGGGLSDGIPFHLAALCPSAVKMYVAVVRSSGLIARGSGLTSSFKASTGNYVFVTKVVIDACAVIATRGSGNTAVPFDPATVERTSGPAPNTSGIQVRALLFFGGGLVNEAFHTAAVC